MNVTATQTIKACNGFRKHVKLMEGQDYILSDNPNHGAKEILRSTGEKLLDRGILVPKGTYKPKPKPKAAVVA